MRYHHHLLISCSEALSAIFFEDRHADKCIEFYIKRNRKWGGRDRRFFAETVYDCVRWWSLYWQLLGRKPHENSVKILAPSLWRRGLPCPEFEEFKGVKFEDFEKAYNKISNPAVKLAFPQWLYEHIESELGQTWVETAEYFNRPNKLILRVNTQKTTQEQLIQNLAQDDVLAKRLEGTSSGLIIEERANVFRTQSFKKGLFEVQDGSSQQVASYLQIEPGQRVIDACAGAGGKSLHIADLLENKGKVIALDIHQWKLDQLKLRARRNSYSNIEMKVIEGSKTIKRLKESADRLLLDVPCSGLGVLRRNPDTKWKVSETSIQELISLQAEILEQYSRMLKPGGLMVYSTCSVLPSENEEQISKFLRNNKNFKLLKQRSIFPTRDGFDGFFMAQLEKS